MKNNKHYQRFYKHIGEKRNTNPLVKENIKAIRKQYGLSQRTFAEMLDINLRTLQDYELGRCDMSQTAVALFNFAKKDVAYFKKFIKENPQPYCY